jgi:pyridoxal phosphate-dependent aminotransferase EpsN
MRTLPVKIEARRRVFERYERALAGVPGISFMPEASFGRSTRWLTCLLLDETRTGVSRAQIVRAMEERNIETRPVWRPLHRQPLFAGSEFHGGAVSEKIGEQGLSLPSSSYLTEADQQRVIDGLLQVLQARP